MPVLIKPVVARTINTYERPNNAPSNINWVIRPIMVRGSNGSKY